MRPDHRETRHTEHSVVRAASAQPHEKSAVEMHEADLAWLGMPRLELV